MKSIIPLLGIFSVNIFFTVSSLIGYEYTGIEDSKIYVIYLLLIAIANGILFLKGILIKKYSFSINEFVVVLLPMFVTFLFLIRWLLNGNVNSLALTYYLYFCLWIVPVIFAAIIIKKENLYSDLVRYLEVVMLIFTISMLKETVIPFFNGNSFVGVGGSTYQVASYISAFAFGLNMYFLLYGSNHKRFKFTKMKTYRIICILLLFIQLFGVFYTGGRGGFVLILAYILYFTLSYMAINKRLNAISTIKIIFVIAFSLVALSIVLPKLLQNPRFAWAFNRTIKFINNDGINWDASLMRTSTYKYVIDLIFKKPVLGYGLYGFWDYSGYPHNIVLELLLNGGILFLTIASILFINLFFKQIKLIKSNPQYRLISIIGIYPAVMLMFSGSYMINSQFWFVIIYIIITCKNYNRKY